MLRAFSFLVKVAVFSLIAIVAGYWIRWGDSSLSDQVGRFSEQAKEKAVSFAEGREGKARQRAKRPAPVMKGAQTSAQPQEEIFPSEREKLREFIREIQGTHTARNQDEGR